jgi:glucose-induced degradation protein 8
LGGIINSDADVPSRDVNNLIMDYLINEGYPSAAEKFAMEANIEQPSDDSNILLRVQIRDSIHRGDLQQAIELISEASPEVCTATILPFQTPFL